MSATTQQKLIDSAALLVLENWGLLSKTQQLKFRCHVAQTWPEKEKDRIVNLERWERGNGMSLSHSECQYCYATRFQDN